MAPGWGDLAGRRVGVWGLGVEGTASLRRLLADGARPVLVDDAVTGPVEGLPVAAWSRGGREALLGCDVVVAAPGISRYGAAVAELTAAGVTVTGGLALWLAEVPPGRVVAVTGSKGKSTTSAVTAHLLDAAGRRAAVVGNFGVAPYDPATVGPEPDVWVVEVSSYQAHDVGRVPGPVGITALHPDHLPWHGGSVETYYRDKLSLATREGVTAVVANGDSDRLRAAADEGLLGPAPTWVRVADAAGQDWAGRFGPGDHNRRNALIALALVRALGGPGLDTREQLDAASRGYEPLAHRLQELRVHDGVTFVDDSLSTNVLSCIAAAEAYPDRRLALIVGGADRGIDYTDLGRYLAGRTSSILVLAVPDNAASVVAGVARGGPGPLVEVRSVRSVAEAVAAGAVWARPDGVVLLSPAAASFGVFRDYAHRAEVFAAAVAAVGAP